MRKKKKPAPLVAQRSRQSRETTGQAEIPMKSIPHAAGVVNSRLRTFWGMALETASAFLIWSG